MSVDREIYHVGFLARDREPPHSLNNCRCSLCLRAAEVSATADDRWRAFKRGELTLTQRRVGDGRWEYLAISLAGAP